MLEEATAFVFGCHLYQFKKSVGTVDCPFPTPPPIASSWVAVL